MGRRVVGRVVIFMGIRSRMGIRSWLIRPYAQAVAARVRAWSQRPVEAQQAIFHQLVGTARHTAFGHEHGFADIKTHQQYRTQTPLRDYEQLSPWIARIKAGERDVLWPGKPRYFAKTSGTTSGVKYIPITNASIGNHFYSAQTAMLLFMAETGRYRIMDGRMIFLSGSPELEQVAGIPTGRLSGIVNHEIPSYLKGNQLPTWPTNCIDDWDTKLQRIVDETITQDMRLISGIPPWVQMYFDELTHRTGKPIKDIFPNFEVLVYGGVNFTPYRDRMMHSIGKPIASVETYPASEGFFAYQDSQHAEGLLLNVNSGIYFEFVPADEIFNPTPTRLSLAEVQTGINYALIVNSNAGLWGYNIGDTVRFVSTNPYRIVVTGRIKHYISAFGEHVIGEEVEQAMAAVSKVYGTNVVEFTVAPQVNPSDGLPYHEWLVEFAEPPTDKAAFATALDEQMRQRNIYYNDLITGGILRPLQLRTVGHNGFIDYMRGQGKLGGQNKVPRLANDRTVADGLQPFIIV